MRDEIQKRHDMNENKIPSSSGLIYHKKKTKTKKQKMMLYDNYYHSTQNSPNRKKVHQTGGRGRDGYVRALSALIE